jgi:hypothetical protein
LDKQQKEETMTNTKVKWFNEDYDLGCDVSKLEELGFENSSWKDDIAPSFANDKMQIYFLNRKKFKEHEGRSKFSINKILNDGSLKGIYETDYFYKVLQLAKLSNEINKNQ